jgi:hypothetical protein
MTTPGYDFQLSGESWPNPNHITYSIAPDGVFWDHGTNNLNATFDARFGTGGIWQAQIARALATWESVANINIAPVADGPYDFNTLGSAQGDPRFGDIRFGGYGFPGNTTTLAQTYFPPPNGSTAAGDVEVNTSMNINIGSTYDLYSLLLHETGHSLGLDHAKNPVDVMYEDYQGVRTGLAAGDIAGIQAIYGARTQDGYQSAGQGLSFAAPIDVSSALSGSNRAVVSSASLASIGSTEYFSFVAPAFATGTLQVTAAASNMSMLSPSVSVFDATGNLLAQGSNPAAWSDDATATVPLVTPGQRYYVSVTGATGDVFSVGAYQLVVSLPNSAPPSPPPSPPSAGNSPPASSGSGLTPDRFEPNGTATSATWLGRVTQDTIGGINLTSGLDVDYFKFQTGTTGTYVVSAPGTLIQIYNSRGRFVAGGANVVNLPRARAGTPFLVRIAPPSFQPVAGYSLSITPRSVPRATRKMSRPRHQEINPTERAGQSSAADHLGPDAIPSRASTSIGVRNPDIPAHPTEIPRENPAWLEVGTSPWKSHRAIVIPLRKEAGESDRS